MRILLIATNRHNRLMSRLEARPLPIGLAYIAGYLDQTRHTVKTLDLMFSGGDYLDEVERTVLDFRPEVVGISLRNLSNHSYLDPQWALPLTRGVIERIREVSDATVVCGVTLGEYSFVGAGAVVTSDVPPYAIMVGVPSRRVGWMCNCGERLLGTGTTFVCDSCQRRYSLQSGSLVNID